jgi:phosphate starvation-inducible protein PhoH and related proteins
MFSNSIDEVFEYLPTKGRGKKQKRTPKSNNAIDFNLQLKHIEPKTIKQQDAFSAYDHGQNLLLHGVAGTGKTFIALYLALKSLLENNSKYKKIIIVRSAVPSRDIGFLPGNAKEKMAVYEAPYQAIFSELFGRDDAYNIFKTKKQVEFIPTSFIRGLTINNAIILVDELQNCTDSELNTVITRCGRNTKMLLAGDHRQDDLSGKKGEMSGLKTILGILKRMNTVSTIDFGIDDIQRSQFVREYLIQRIELGLDKPIM